MKRSTILCLSLPIVVCVSLGTWVEYTRGQQCAKCLASQQITEQQVLGITFSSSTRDVDASGDYERIFGHSCDHVFRKSGFGKTWYILQMSGSGLSGDIFIRPRMEAVTAAFDVEHRLHDRDLALETLQLIDTLMPADMQRKQLHDFTDEDENTIYLLSPYLNRAKTAEQWRAVLDAAHASFKDTSNLPVK